MLYVLWIHCTLRTPIWLSLCCVSTLSCTLVPCAPLQCTVQSLCALHVVQSLCALQVIQSLCAPAISTVTDSCHCISIVSPEVLPSWLGDGTRIYRKGEKNLEIPRKKDDLWMVLSFVHLPLVPLPVLPPFPIFLGTFQVILFLCLVTL